jgi:alkyl hydroperoxide reductase subunit AhpC
VDFLRRTEQSLDFGTPAGSTPHQLNVHNVALRLGELAPDFTAETTDGPIRFHEWIGDNWCVLFSHPGDFTPVCTTELGIVARLKPEFDRRNVKVIALSVDPLDSHCRWLDDIEATQQCMVSFPIIADPSRKVAVLYDMIHPQADDRSTVRSVFIIAPDKRIMLTFTYPASTGRNFAELLRVIDALQISARYPLATPADWRKGEECIVLTSVNDEEAARRFPGGIRRVNHYLRYTPQPTEGA